MIVRRLAPILLAVLFALPAHAGEFEKLASAIASTRGIKRIPLPFLGLARFAVRIVEPEGVYDFQIATFEGDGDIDRARLEPALRSLRARGFMPLVQVWSNRKSEFSYVYVRPHEDGRRVEVYVVAHDASDTAVVRVEVDAAKIAMHLGDEPRGVIDVARR